MKHSINHAALVISRVFEPIAVLPALALVGGARAGLGQSEFLFYILFLLCSVLVPVGLFIRWRRKVKVIPWDMPDRRTRIRPLIIGSLLALVYFFADTEFNYA